jgi:hypothetical protein
MIVKAKPQSGIDDGFAALVAQLPAEKLEEMLGALCTQRYEHVCGTAVMWCCDAYRCEFCHVGHLHAQHDTQYRLSWDKTSQRNTLIPEWHEHAVPAKLGAKHQPTKLAPAKLAKAAPAPAPALLAAEDLSAMSTEKLMDVVERLKTLMLTNNNVRHTIV